MAALPAPPPLAPGAFGNVRADARSGFLVFLIALPLCLAVARASGFPPAAGIWTAVVGGVVCPLVSNSQLTIKGPAVGLVVVVSGAVSKLGGEFATADMSAADRAYLGYRLALGIGVTAGVIQVLLGLLRAGRLADVFPLTPVHGVLAGVGLAVVARQLYEVVGVAAPHGAGPLALLAKFPGRLRGINPEIAVIGVAGLVILFGLPAVAARVPALKRAPGPLVVLAAGVGLGLAFDLEHRHTYLFPDSLLDLNHRAEHEVGPRFLVDVPEVFRDPGAALAAPDFRGLATATGLRYLVLFTLVGSLESLLGARAVELIDPWRRKTDFDRDLLAVGLGNTLASAVGGLPMISEIVRSKANVDYGGRTRAANAVHGLCLLGFVLLLPNLLHRVPLAALGAMLVYTGVRLADPRGFVRTYRVGGEQFVIFVGTVAATLAADPLAGVAAGVGLKVLVHLWNGCPPGGFLTADVAAVPAGDSRVVLGVRRAAVFSNWLGLRRTIVAEAAGREEVVLDLSETRLVDHSTMEKLHELEADFAAGGKRLTVVGLDAHVPLSNHPLAARQNAVRPRVPAGVG